VCTRAFSPGSKTTGA